MKKIIAITIALCLVLSSFSCAFAADWTSSQISSVVNDVNIISASIDDIFTAFAGQTGIMYNTISEMMSWLTPVGSFSSSDSLTGYTLYEMIDFICYLLGYSGQAAATIYDFIGSIDSTLGSLNSLMTTNNIHLSSLLEALTNEYPSKSSTWTTWVEMRRNSHQDLLYGSNFATKSVGDYYLPTISSGSFTSNGVSYSWFYGSPLGNIALILKRGMLNDAQMYKYRWDADLTHYNDNLTTWDSQSDTLTQVAFTPESAIQGLYRYLAFTQRDVARLTYVFASDQELAAREKAQGNQTAALNNFIDPNGNGSVSVSNINSMATQSGYIKDNLYTQYSPTGVWDVFSSLHFIDQDNWFSQTTANNLDTTASVASVRNTKSIQPVIEEDYPTPLLDAYYEEIYSLQGDLDD